MSGSFPVGDYIWKNTTPYLNSSATSTSDVWLYHSINTSAPVYTHYAWNDKNVVTCAEIEELIKTTQNELLRIHQRYNILDPDLRLCEVLAAKMLFAKLPKGTAEFGVSAPLVAWGNWPDQRRNVFLLVKVSNQLNQTTTEHEDAYYIADVCSNQHGGLSLQAAANLLAAPWIADIKYKSPTNLVKRLHKEGHQLKELHLKDAIALSTRYTVSNASPTQLFAHQINPQDAEGRKFLEKFGKEVGFKTTLAQLLLDADPMIAEKAQFIAEILLKR